MFEQEHNPNKTFCLKNFNWFLSHPTNNLWYMASPLEWNTAKPALVTTSIKQYMASPLEWNTAKPALVTTSIKQYMASPLEWNTAKSALVTTSMKQ